MQMTFTPLKRRTAYKPLRLCTPSMAVDLLVSDIQMPEMDGFTMACAVRAGFPLIPVILVSGQAAIDPATILNAGFEFVQKPFQPATFLSAVEKAMRGRTPPARGHSAS